ncbi:MAG: CHAP domain-containing protein, partial [Dysosmobacter sp.]|nr:CHAP domain-containing protein [Dysosmobacter sp.]
VKYNTWYYGREVSGAAYPWCMAFVQWLFAQVGMKLPYLTASCSALLAWYKAHRPEQVVKEPRPGDVVIYNFGHTGVVEAVGAGTVTAIEGNTSPGTAGSQSNGGMVCRRTRKTTTVTAYIRPDYEEEDEDMFDIDRLTDAEVLKLGQRLQTVMGRQSVGPKLAEELEEAKDRGITDGSNPGAFCTRAQAAVMTLRATRK